MFDRLIQKTEALIKSNTVYINEDKVNGIYSDHAGGYYQLPRCEFLLHNVKSIEEKLLTWYKENKYSQGDSYNVRVTNKGKWAVSHSNDYLMQHGDGKEHILTEEEFNPNNFFDNKDSDRDI